MIKTKDKRYWLEPGYIPHLYHARPEALCYKLRKIVTNNQCGDVFGITIPASVGSEFEGCYFQISRSGCCIILRSGNKILQNQ